MFNEEISQKHRIQIICTTYSPAILDSLPPEAGFYIESVGQETIITEGISGAFAAGRLADNHSNELDIFVEDFVGETLVNSFFDLESRQRVGIIPIGSHSAVCRQLAAAYKHPKLKSKSIAILDGDQQSHLQSFISKMMTDLELSTDLEKSKFKEWVKNRILFLLGSINPEKWILEKSLIYIDKYIAQQFGVSQSRLKQEFELAIRQTIHEEFYYLAKSLTLTEDSIIKDLCRLVARNERVSFQSILKSISLPLVS